MARVLRCMMELGKMSVVETCQQCGAALAKSEVPFGAGSICPRCLLGLGLSDHDVTEAAQAGSIRSLGRQFRAPDVDQLVGRFPNLEIQHLIGYGGMGAVYQARQVALDRTVALKILAPGLSNDETFAQRFTREAKTLARLSHPNIVMIFEFGQADDFHYLLMEYVDGINLRDAILEGTLKTDDALTIIPQICDALQYAHDEGVVHRDIKPENILIDRKGRVKIADFGLAKLLQPNAEDLRLTGTQQVLGTLNYMAPEQIEGRLQVDHRADIYSLGVVFYELLTGELPIGRFAVPSEKSGAPNGLDDVVLKTLEKEPERRYQAASEVKTAVQDAATQSADETEFGVEVVMADQAIPGSRPPENPQPIGKDASRSKNAANPKAAGTQTAAFNRPFGVGGQPIDPTVSEQSVPFTIDQVYGGFASAFGILKYSERGLELEYEIRDEILKSIRAKSRLVQIPINQLSSVKLTRGLTGDRIEFQARSLAVTDDIPNARSGSFTLKTKKVVRENAERLVHQIARQIDPHAPLPPNPSPTGSPTLMEQLARPFRGLLRLQPSRDQVRPIDVSNRFSGVRFWFTTCAILNFVMMGGSLRKVIHQVCTDFRIELPQGLQEKLLWMDMGINPFSERFLQASTSWSFVLSIMLFVASGKLSKLQSYYFVALTCALLLIPVYPLYLLLAPWALWGLFQLMRPSTIAVFEDCQSCSNDTQTLPGKNPARVSRSGQHFIGRFLTVVSLMLVGGLIATGVFSTAYVKGPRPTTASGNETGDAAADSAETESPKTAGGTETNSESAGDTSAAGISNESEDTAQED